MPAPKPQPDTSDEMAYFWDRARTGVLVQQYCTACHTYAGSGGSNLGAPDLTNIASRHLGIATQIKHLQNPSSVTPGSPMPSFASLGNTRLHQLAVFLEASKGTH